MDGSREDRTQDGGGWGVVGICTNRSSAIVTVYAWLEGAFEAFFVCRHVVCTKKAFEWRWECRAAKGDGKFAFA